MSVHMMFRFTASSAIPLYTGTIPLFNVLVKALGYSDGSTQIPVFRGRLETGDWIYDVIFKL